MKKNKNLIKLLFLLIVCIFILLIYKMINIYALFHSEMEGHVTFENGTWNITVNGQDITTGLDTEFVINQINTTQNDYVKPGKLAPGLAGNFELVINPEDTNVSIRYDVTLNQEELGESSLTIKSIKEIEKGYELIKTAENTYTGIIPLADIKNGITHKIKMEVEWADNGLNDEGDTEIGKNPTHQLQIPITFHAIQYLGEEITPYVPEIEMPEEPEIPDIPGEEEQVE